ncbi:4-hydroxy-tetrahydrodipicolinate synthase [Tsukamurella sp. 8F]|uniref:4-hydroxy-tetrahydrodipicolinate synthase n=1 Tax=unclassified Tsukamurella TaxID=2633480 RepID=UPI0023B8FDA8|nr:MULTISPECIES: 4-hydroxy-tetrahydrodipicolinate synthase [unclassified Tsukamurella]MDF0530519.1 4-hydroxy-tetrahydrodipicolinate synthase [Tsukamurella sp. 8J]MDF0586831.1 4-hydroxy-tetrahydrodipicolinate synthase [Tsukamurella sp. 8F]
MNLAGLHIPLVTPFTADDRVDTAALESLAARALDAGAAGLVALGTTGEPASLTSDERRTVVDVCAAACGGRALLTVCAGGNATAATASDLAALDPRADAALVTVPYYTRPTEAGVVEHFRALAGVSSAPIIVYDAPERTARPLGIEALRALGDIDGVIGFKHAPGAVTDVTMRLLAEQPHAVLGGDDTQLPAVLALGARGGITASANVAPDCFVALVAAWRDGRVDEARALGAELVPIAAALFAEPNPVVIKAALAAQARISSPAVRLPLLPSGMQSTADAVRALGRLRDRFQEVRLV